MSDTTTDTTPTAPAAPTPTAMSAGDITTAVNAIAPIMQINFTNGKTPGSWNIQFQPTTTDEQRVALQAWFDSTLPYLVE